MLRRAGQTEGAVDLARWPGSRPAGVICEIMNDDGTMARMPDLREFAKEHDSQDPVDRRPDPVPNCAPRSSCAARRGELPSTFGDFRAIVFKNDDRPRRPRGAGRGEIHADGPCWCASTASA